jgi:hypothetical protein
MSLSSIEIAQMSDAARATASGSIGFRAEMTANLIHAYEQGLLTEADINRFVEFYKSFSQEP